jgi:hypothetical protein
MTYTAPFQVRVGPAYIWIAPVGTVPPLVAVAPAAAWIDLGRTEGGLTLRHVKETTEIMIDQALLPLKDVPTKKGLEIEFSLAEITTARDAKIMEGASVTVVAAGAGVSGTDTFPLLGGDENASWAMLIRVPSGNLNGLSQYELANVARTGNAELPFKKDEKTVIPTSWKALEDPSTPGRFGVFREYTAVAA